MPDDVIQANYDELVAVAARFGDQAAAQTELVRAVRERAEVLTAGSWEGRGVEAFAGEMHGTVMPAMTRLIDALEEAQRVALEIHTIMRDAEEEASSSFRSAYSAERQVQVGRDIDRRIDELRQAGETPDITSVYDSEQVLAELMAPEKRVVIEKMANRYGIEPALLAGVIASEMDFDYDVKDVLQDFAGQFGFAAGSGHGKANVHTDLNLAWATNYLTDHGMDGSIWATQYNKSVRNRSSFEGSVEAAAIVTAVLANEHGGVHSAEDMAVVWAAYRTGINGLIPGDPRYGFDSLANYRNHIARDTEDLAPPMRMGGNAYMSQPYFEYFIQAFAEKPPTRPTPVPVPTPSPQRR